VSAQKLNATFGIPGVLRFEQTANGLVLARISTPSGNAMIYLQGEHLTHWQPVDELPVLFTSARSPFSPGEAVRGGIPVVFPWFGPYAGDLPDGCRFGLHGFARTAPWTLLYVGIRGDGFQLTFSLSPNELSRALGFDHFCLAYTLRIGHSLELKLAVHNEGAETLYFEEALHTYYAIEDIRRTYLRGLAGTAYLDGVDRFTHKRQAETELRFDRRTDSIYLDTAATCILHDEGNKRLIVIEKSGSQTTVVWNPGDETEGAIPGLGPGDWRKFLSVETANASSNAITLASGATHHMIARITVLPD
jgi:glucose-6-phosphate 1-epimerase